MDSNLQRREKFLDGQCGVSGIRKLWPSIRISGVKAKNISNMVVNFIDREQEWLGSEK
jgi:hypothetical protein